MMNNRKITRKLSRSAPKAADPKGDRERLKQRLLREGADGLTEVEILELLLTFAIPGRDLPGKARELIERFGDLTGVLRGSSSELTQVEGVGDHTATLVRLAGEIAARCAVTIYPPTEILRHPKETERYLVSRMGAMKEENVLLVFLNDQGVILGEEMLGGGTVNQVVVFPRQVMQKALQHNASALLIVHNHPHGPPLPTLRDREEAERLREAMRPFDVTVKDLIVVGAGRCFSIFKNSPL